MATATEDPRLKKIYESTVYGLFHEGLMLYIGSTRLPLRRRLNLHTTAAQVGQGLRVSSYIREHVDDEREELSIKELPYDTENEAIEKLGESTLNSRGGGGGVSEDDLYPWSSWELDILEEQTLEDAVEMLDASYEDCRIAATKLGCLEAEKSPHLSDPKVKEIWRRYHSGEDVSYTDVAEELGTNPSTVGCIVRCETYADVRRPPVGSVPLSPESASHTHSARSPQGGVRPGAKPTHA